MKKSPIHLRIRPYLRIAEFRLAEFGDMEELIYVTDQWLKYEDQDNDIVNELSSTSILFFDFSIGMYYNAELETLGLDLDGSGKPFNPIHDTSDLNPVKQDAEQSRNKGTNRHIHGYTM